jgi:hypothetical protein
MSLLGLEIWVGHLGSLLCPFGGSVQPSIVAKLRPFVKPPGFGEAPLRLAEREARNPALRAGMILT